MTLKLLRVGLYSKLSSYPEANVILSIDVKFRVVRLNP